MALPLFLFCSVLPATLAMPPIAPTTAATTFARFVKTSGRQSPSPFAVCFERGALPLEEAREVGLKLGLHVADGLLTEDLLSELVEVEHLCVPQVGQLGRIGSRPHRLWAA